MTITVIPHLFHIYVEKKYFFEAQLGVRKESKQGMWVAKIDAAQAFSLSDSLEKTRIHVGRMKKWINKPIYALILKRVLINLHVYFLNQ